MTNQELYDKLKEILPDIKRESKWKKILTLLKDLLLPASVVLLGFFTLRASKVDSKNNMQIKYLELFYNDITDSSKTKQSNALDLLSSMSPELSKKLSNWVASFKQELTINIDSTSEDMRLEELLAENENLKTRNAQLRYELLQSGDLRREKVGGPKTFDELKGKIRNVIMAFNSIKLNDSKYESTENRLLTQNGKLVTMGGRALTTKVKINKYNYSIADLTFELNNKIDSLAINPILDFKVQFNLKTNTEDVQNKLTADTISIKFQTPSGYITNKNSEYLKVIPAKLDVKNQFSFDSFLNSFTKGQYFLRFYINNVEIGEGSFNI